MDAIKKLCEKVKYAKLPSEVSTIYTSIEHLLVVLWSLGCLTDVSSVSEVLNSSTIMEDLSKIYDLANTTKRPNILCSASAVLAVNANCVPIASKMLSHIQKDFLLLIAKLCDHYDLRINEVGIWLLRCFVFADSNFKEKSKSKKCFELAIAIASRGVAMKKVS